MSVRHRRSARPVMAAACALSTAALLAPAAHAAAPAANRSPSITAEITAPDMVRADRVSQVAVVFRGVDAKTKVRVNWGDGSPTQVRAGSCGIKGATQYPDACTVTFTRATAYAPGTYTITAAGGASPVSKTLTVVPAPAPWTPPAGWVQPGGWSRVSTGATYVPCQRVDWYFDRAGEPGDRNTMRDDVFAGLALLARETGLTFAETADPSASDLTFNWRDLTSYGANVAGVGGPKGIGKGEVSFSLTSDWTKNVWAGAGKIRLTDYPRPGWWWEHEGRQSLVIHEVMHALGLGHVNDPTSIMNPVSGNRTVLNGGDQDGLHTMYKSNPCPPIPD